MKASIRNKLEQAEARLDEVGALLADPEVLAQPDRYRELSVEYAQLSPLVERYHSYESIRKTLEQAREMMADGDRDLRALAEDEAEQAEARLAALEQEIRAHLLPADPYDNNNLFLEIRAGTGGHEAALFAGDLLRMYTRYAERRGWKLDVLSESPGEYGGYKEVIARVDGRGAYAHLKFESGVHRVQRVPETESQGRIHTSACTVAVLPEVPEVEAEAINTSDLRIDTFRSSGAGGQHVNKTDSAIRITHLPSGIVVECQEERSQHKNRARALAFLQAKLLDQERQRRDAERAEERRSQVGSGDRSERIRTYNFPQGRVTDHRINLTLHQLESILDGDLEPVTSALRDEAHTQQLAALGE